jgi:hypothetical protein
MRIAQIAALAAAFCAVALVATVVLASRLAGAVERAFWRPVGFVSLAFRFVSRWSCLAWLLLSERRGDAGWRKGGNVGEMD